VLAPAISVQGTVDDHGPSSVRTQASS
jgi:hypothetical protein